MKARLSTRTESGSTPVFVLKEDATITRHPSFQELEVQDRDFLAAFLKKSPVKDGHSHLVFLPSTREAILLGVAVRGNFTHRKAILAARRVVAFTRRERVRKISVSGADFEATAGAVRLKPRMALRVLGTQLTLANFEFLAYKTPPKEGWNFVEQISIVVPRATSELSEALQCGVIIGEETNRARALSNTPGGDMTPEMLAEIAMIAGRETGFSVTVLGVPEMEKLGMGGILGVGKGSSAMPRFIVIEYLKGKKHDAPVVLVGKGVTFDSGGLNLKPEASLYEMHMDMSGGAAVVHTIAALARMQAKVNVVGLVPAVENMLSGSSYRPGDQLRSMSGKTIEVINTDAEGRVILADALTYAKRYHPKLIVDVATLTGASMVALGQRASALFTNSPKLEHAFRAVGEATGDFVWPLPLWEEYEEEVRGTFGDLANSTPGRLGGAIKGAMFLWQFVKDSSASTGAGRTSRVPAWVHLDIAPRMTSIEGEFLTKGAAGATVPLLTTYLLGT